MRWHPADDMGSLVRQLKRNGGETADAVGQAAQTRHQAQAHRDDGLAEAMWDVARAASLDSVARVRRLRIVTITTDSPGSFGAWVKSLRAALDEAAWLPGRGPEIEVLRVANDSEPEVDAAHRAVSAEGIQIRVVDVERHRRPLPLVEARPFAFSCLGDLGWVPSPQAPVWSLDEDFRFDTLVPSPTTLFVRRSGGPLLHRLDAMVARLSREGVDVVIGGNTGAAPVPALGLVLGQTRDLAADTSQLGSLRITLGQFAKLADAYYDLAGDPSPGLRVPLTWAWWRRDSQVNTSELVTRLQAGLPVTRPALAMPLRNPPDAWATFEHDGTAGGNTLLLSPKALNAHFVHVRCGSLISRRADTTWAINARTRGVRVLRASLPLFHDRHLRPQTPNEAAREALRDALGVGVYRSMRDGDMSAARVLTHAYERVALLRTQLVKAEATARRASSRCPWLVDLAEWIAEARDGLILKSNIPVDFHQAAPRPPR